MRSTIVGRLDKFEGISFSNWPSNPCERLLQPLQVSLEKKESVAVLIFGPPGTGKTTLAITVAKAISSQLPGYRALFVDCSRLAMLPELTWGRTDRVSYGEEVMDVSLLDEAADAWVIVLDGVCAVPSSPFLSSEARKIWGRIDSLWQAEIANSTTLILATSRDPSSMPPEFTERFNMMFHMSSFSANEMPKWLMAAGLREPFANALYSEVKQLLTDSGLEMVAPYAFMRALNRTFPSRQGTLRQAPTLAKRFCASASGSFFDGKSIHEYETHNRAFITQSNFLNQLFYTL